MKSESLALLTESDKIESESFCWEKVTFELINMINIKMQ